MSIIRRIKTSHKWLKEFNYQQRSLKREEIIPLSTDINDEKMIIIKNDKYVKQFKSIFAISVFSNFVDILGKQITILTVVTDNIYDQLSDNAKRFIILHEKGHFIHHFDKIITQTNYSRNLEDEIKADEYAIDELGIENVISALKEMKNTIIFPDTVKELKKRISHLEKIKNKE